ncbi:MAG: radical SAM protein [Bacteroidota bacterium]
MITNAPANNLFEVAEKLTGQIAVHSRPRSPQIHLVPGASGTQLLVPNGSRLYRISPEIAQRLKGMLDNRNEPGISAELVALGLDTPAMITDEPLQSPAVHAISLAIAQKCNMGCSYCYADQGDFGGPMKNMPLETAKKSIDLLLKSHKEGDKAQLTFLGGEPLINRKALREATAYAYEKAFAENINIGFSVTTNGTLLTADDAVFFEQYGFSVTVSLDGLKEQHDLLRPMKGGAGSYERIMENIKPLLEAQRKMQVSARVTVTPDNLDLPGTLDAFVDMGFHSIGFSPLLRSSSGTKEMSEADMKEMLAGMIACGLKFEENVLKKTRYPFLNMVNALKEIDKGTHRPYPCGAGAGYMGVSADGDLAACHRFVNEPAGKMGDIAGGVDPLLQNNWLASRHVHQQQPCNQCWARYLCGGGCHHEVLEKGRNACDYIRGWLHYTLQAHERLSRMAPGWFN